tara:strand:+ start:6788 stop:7162 length:375 start_codon:yes stop_codon:yes gene_type:complete
MLAVVLGDIVSTIAKRFMKTKIVVTLEHSATHYWKDCDIDEVMYLKYPHRHNFHFVCKKEVSHDDRDIEFIMLKNSIKGFLNETYPKTFGGMSCESIAKELMHAFDLSYCAVLEDNENGAEVTR